MWRPAEGWVVLHRVFSGGGKGFAVLTSLYAYVYALLSTYTYIDACVCVFIQTCTLYVYSHFQLSFVHIFVQNHGASYRALSSLLGFSCGLVGFCKLPYTNSGAV